MKRSVRLALAAGILVIGMSVADAATVLVSDNYNVTGSGSGFALGSGVNTGINPPTTRLTGSLASGLRYMNTGTKATTAFTITSSKLQVASAANPGRFVLSANGSTPFDFGPGLGISGATVGTPVSYDLAVSMKNNSTGTQRFSFALGTSEGDATTWAFGIQFYRVNSANNFYTIQKRIDVGASGLATDLDKAMYTMGANTFGTQIDVLVRVTDAGSEASTFNSRVQVSLNGGSTWIYDTASDSDLPNGWRLNGSGRVIIWDQAPSAGNVTYDNFSLTWNLGPLTWTGGGANGNWSTAANWGGGVAPGAGAQLNFAGSTRTNNTNDLSGLSISSVVFKNGGFTTYGNDFTNSTAVTNNTGINTVKGGMAWSGTGVKTWSVASGAELVLDNTTTVEVGGDHSIYGGGTLRVKGALNIGQGSGANPAFIVNDGRHMIDGGSFVSKGGYRIGSLATAANGATTILTNNATLNLNASSANLRVGDSANPVTSSLIINGGTLSMSGGILAVPFAVGATGAVVQTGGTVSGGLLSFSDVGAGSGSYTISGGGILQPTQVREGTASGNSAIYFNGATLRTASGANSTFMTGLNTAQIQAGGLTIDATTADITIGQVLSGTGALTKSGANKVTLTGVNTYSGNTTVAAGTLAIGGAGSVASSPNVTLNSGTTLDVSGASGFTFAATQTVAREAASGNGTISGSPTFALGAKLGLSINATNGAVGTVAVSGNLTVNSTTFTINIANGPLAAGTYLLLTYTGTKSGSFNPVPTITGAGISMGLAATIVESAGAVSLKVYLPAHRVSAANILVTQNDSGNHVESVDVTADNKVNGFDVRSGSNRGDYLVQVGPVGTDDAATGVLLASVAQNGRDNDETSGINYCTAGISSGGTTYSVIVATAPSGKEYNINVSSAFFPYTNWVGGYARNSSGTANGPNDLITASPGISLGTQFVDNGNGTATINLSSLGINSQTDGVLLVTAGANDDDYALSAANTNGTWTVYTKDNGTNGAVFEEDPIAFVFIPKTNMSVISGKFQGDGSILMYNGSSPRFAVTNTATGVWQLSIPGYTPKNGVLIISAENDGAAGQDNIVSFQASGNNWNIQARDLPQLGLQTPAGAVCSFVFIPAPTATLVSPANFATGVSSSPNLTVNVTNNAAGNMSLTFVGHNAGKPYPGKDFLMCILPDTQNYAREASSVGHATRQMWYAQTDWIVSRQYSDNVAYVGGLGDIVQDGDNLSGSPNEDQWQIATNAMYRLEDPDSTTRPFGIPYGCSVGNHDQEPNGDKDGTTRLYNKYFGSSHWNNKPYYGGNYDTNNDSWFNLFSAGGLDFIVFSYEYDRYGSGVLGWTDDVLLTNQNRRIIVLTHHAPGDCGGTACGFSTQGQAIYDHLKVYPNFFLMMGGHVFNGAGDGEGRRTDTYNGNTVRTLVSDYQGRNNGGDGLMRLMYFSPSNSTVSVKTYSPYTDTFETDANSQFSFSYNMQLPTGPGTPATTYTNISAAANVTSGSQNTTAWGGLAPSQTYEWYVTITNDVGDSYSSPIWQFSTSSGFAPSMVQVEPAFEWWKQQNKIIDPSADDDADGQSNYSEYVAGTDPHDSKSAFQILKTTRGSGGFGLSWASVGGKRYRVQYCDNLTAGFVDFVRDAKTETDSAAAGQASQQSFTDASAPTNEIRYYRIMIVP